MTNVGMVAGAVFLLLFHLLWKYAEVRIYLTQVNFGYG